MMPVNVFLFGVGLAGCWASDSTSPADTAPPPAESAAGEAGAALAVARLVAGKL